MLQDPWYLRTLYRISISTLFDYSDTVRAKKLLEFGPRCLKFWLWLEVNPRGSR